MNNQGGSNINGDLLIEINNWIEKIEGRLDGLEKWLNNLAWERGSHTVSMGNEGIDEGRFKDLEHKLNNHI